MSDHGGDGGDRATAERDRDRPNVLLLVMDTARARDVLGRQDVMPKLHERAAAGVTFENVFTTAPWTLPSHASMFTGQHTSDHGTHAGSRAFDPDVAPLAEQLGSHGYQTVAFSNNSWVSSDFGFDRGFEAFRPGWAPFESDVDLIDVAKDRDGRLDQARALGEQLSVRDLPATLGNVLYAKLLRRRVDDGAWVTNRQIRQWFDRDRDDDRPFFAFVNYLEPHLEYRPPRGYRSTFLPDDVDYAEAKEVNQDAWAYIAGDESMTDREFEVLRGLYRAELNYLDSRIDRLLDALRERGELANTAVFVVADHGENVGDHGLMDHQYCLYDTLMHVPLFYLPPENGSIAPSSFSSDDDQAPASASDEELRELRDLHPTILDLAGIEPPQSATVSQRSLLDPRGREYVVGEYVHPQPDPAELRARVDSVEIDLDLYDRGLRCIRTPDWKLVEGTDGSETLYCFPEPDEEVPASDVSPERRTGTSLQKTTLPDGDVSDDLTDVREQLRERLHGDHGEIARPDAEEATEADVDDATQRRLEDLGYI